MWRQLFIPFVRKKFDECFFFFFLVGILVCLLCFCDWYLSIHFTCSVSPGTNWFRWEDWETGRHLARETAVWPHMHACRCRWVKLRGRMVEQWVLGQCYAMLCYLCRLREIPTIKEESIFGLASAAAPPPPFPHKKLSAFLKLTKWHILLLVCFPSDIHASFLSADRIEIF